MSFIDFAKTKQLVKSMMWVFLKYHGFKVRLCNEFGVSHLRFYNVLDWHQGSYYFTCIQNGKKLFIKTDYGFKLLSNEVLAYQKLKSFYCCDEMFVPPVFYDQRNFEFIAYLFLEEETLEYFVLNSSLSTYEIRNIIAKVFAILDCLYEKNIVHRDIKESNFFVTNTGRLILFDFSFSISPSEFNEFNELDVRCKFNKRVLDSMGLPSQVSRYCWDDAYGVYQLLCSLQRVSQIDLTDFINEAERRIGKFSYELTDMNAD